MYRRIAAFAAAGLLLAGQASYAAQGARITAVSGSVMVNQNGRFVPASSGATLGVGDRIMTTGGSARVTYGDGCSVAVKARSMVTVGGASPCAGGSSGVVRVATTPTSAGQSGYEDSAEFSSDESWECSWYCGGSGIGGDAYLWLTFGVVVAGVTASVVADDEQPNSP